MAPNDPPAAAPAPGQGGLGAWARAWRAVFGAQPAPASAPAAGLTYRGYLGADGGADARWTSELEARQTQALLRTAAAAGRLGAWSLEVRGMRWTWSDEVRAIHAVPADFVPAADTVLALYAPDSRELLGQAIEQCMQRGIPFDLELQLATDAGPQAWIHVLGEADRDAQDAITHVRGAMQDISRFRAVADEARRTAERLTQTLEQMTDGYLLLDHDWRFVYVNPAAERILRRRRSRLAGRSLLAEFPETVGGRFLERCRQAARDGRPVEFERYYAPLGIWMQMKVMPSEQGLTICIHDDTERINARRENLLLRARLEALRNASAPPGG